MSHETPIHLPPAEDPSDRPKWRHWTWWLQPFVALPLMLLVLLLLSPFLVRGWHLSQVPDIADPFDVEAFLSETVDDKDNAFVDYHAAEALLVSGNLSHTVLDAGWEKASPALRSLLEANRPALDRWRSGTEKTDAIDGDLRKDTGLSLPEDESALNFVRLALLQGEREQSAGHMAEAWQWYRAVNRFSRHVAQRKDCMGRMLGSNFHYLMAKRVSRWANDPRTTSDELLLALNQLGEDFRLTRPFSELLKVTYCDLPKYTRMYETLRYDPTFGIGSRGWRESKWIRFCCGQPELTTRYNKLVIENWLCASELPHRLQKRIDYDSDSVLDLKAPGSRISGTELLQLLPFCERSVTSYAYTRDYVDIELALQEALRLTLACELWFRRHGRFPDELADLVPDVVPELPSDPFSKLGESFRYFRDGNEAAVYSVGLDEADDGGQMDQGRDIGFRISPPPSPHKSSD